MNSKKKMRNLFAYQLKKNIWLAATGFGALFVALPLCFTRYMQDFQNTYHTPFSQSANLWSVERDRVLYSITYNNYGVAIMLCMLALLNGLVLFSYLSSRKKLDFYLGQPIKRKELFWVTYLQGVVHVLVPYLVCVLITMLLALINNNLIIEFFLVMCEEFVINSLLFLGVYSVVAVACCVTGNTIFSGLGSVVLLGYFPFLFYCWNHVFDGSLNFLSPRLAKCIYISPITLYVKMRSGIQAAHFDDPSIELEVYQYSIKHLIGFISFFLVGLIAARILFVRRNADGAGKPVVFPAVKVLVKGAMVVIASLAATVFFTLFFDEQNTFCKSVGTIVGIIVSIYILDAIMELNWKASFAKWKWQWVYALAGAATVICFYKYAYQFRYNAFDNIPKYYTQNQAIKDGCVVLEYGTVIGGEDKWDQFSEQVNKKTDCSLRVVEFGYDKPSYYDLVYKNGIIKRYNPYNLFYGSGEMKYARKLTGTRIWEDEKEEGIFFVLTNKIDLTMEQLNTYLNSDNSFGYKVDLEFEK